MLTMDSLTILLQEPAEFAEAMGNHDLYDHVYTWYAYHVYARGTPGLDDLKQAGVDDFCKTTTGDGIDLSVWWFMAK